MADRKYYIDWLRVITIWILVVFHLMVMYQSYANRVQFIQSPILLETLAIPLSLFSVMRIPLLFFVSGMGAYFSLRSRNWKQFVIERVKRILVPLVFGSVAIVPIQAYLYHRFYSQEYSYTPDIAHLWFLINIIMNVAWFIGVFIWLADHPDNKLFRFLRRLLEKSPLAIYLIVLPYILESLAIPSDTYYTLYFLPEVGLLLGAVAFFLGFVFVALGEIVWQSINRIKYYALGLALAMFLLRMFVLEGYGPHILTAVESVSWIIGVLGLGYRYLDRPSRLLTYLSQAAYPFYIIHMVFLHWGALLIFPLELNAWVGFALIALFAFGASFVTFEIIRRLFFVRPLFGLKLK